MAALLWFVGSAYQVFTVGAAWRAWDADIDGAGRRYREQLAPTEAALSLPLEGETAEERGASHGARFARYQSEADRLAADFDAHVERGRRRVMHTFIAWFIIMLASIAGVIAVWPVAS